MGGQLYVAIVCLLDHSKPPWLIAIASSFSLVTGVLPFSPSLLVTSHECGVLVHTAQDKHERMHV